MSQEHEHWKRDQEAEREIRALRAGIKAALSNEAFCFRAHCLEELRAIARQLERDVARIVQVWD